MSFAMEVKEEIVSHTFNDSQKKAFLSGFVKYNGEVGLTGNGETLKLSTTSNKIARTLFSFMRDLFKVHIEVSIIQTQLLKKNQTFRLTIENNVVEILKELHIYVLMGDKIINASDEVSYDMELMRAYLAGIFVAVGSVNSPDTTNYHLEVQFKEQRAADYFINVAEGFGIQFKILKRTKSRFVCYVKKTSAISDFLKLVDASQAVMDFENKIIDRDFTNNINRISNIDISNQTKALVAAERQLEQINKIKKNKQLHMLSPKARALCELRIKYPEATFTELEAEMIESGYPITKSGVSNLFKSIAKFSEEL